MIVANSLTTINTIKAYCVTFITHYSYCIVHCPQNKRIFVCCLPVVMYLNNVSFNLGNKGYLAEQWFIKITAIYQDIPISTARGDDIVLPEYYFSFCAFVIFTLLWNTQRTGCPWGQQSCRKKEHAMHQFLHQTYFKICLIGQLGLYLFACLFLIKFNEKQK